MEDKSYAVTLKLNNVDEPTTYDYETVIASWKNHGIEFVDYAYEVDSKGKLHLHGICKVPKKFYRKKLNQYGLHWMLVEIYDIVGWNAYMRKTVCANKNHGDLHNGRLYEFEVNSDK